jgi:hypothetical protein
MIDFTGKKCSNKISGKTYSGYETNLDVEYGYYTLIFYTSDGIVLRKSIFINN